MSRYDFLNRYAIEHEHFDPAKELNTHIDKELMGDYPSTLINAFAYNPHVNADHISKVVARAKFVPVAVTRAALNNRAATQSHHQEILNKPNKNLSDLADRKRFPTLVEPTAPKY